MLGELRPGTVYQYKQTWARYVLYAGRTGQPIERNATLQAYQKHLLARKQSPQTINSHVAAIANAAKWLNIHLEQPRRLQLRAYKENLQEKVPLKPEHVRRILSAAATCKQPVGQNLPYVLLCTMVSSGCRVAEVCSLRKEHVYSTGIAILGKRDITYREVPVSPACLELLQNFIAGAGAGAGSGSRPDSPWVFSSPRNNNGIGPAPLSEIAARAILAKCCRLARVPHCTPVDLRRFVATQLATRYGVQVAAAQLGHRQTLTTQKYYVLTTDTAGEQHGLPEL